MTFKRAAILEGWRSVKLVLARERDALLAEMETWLAEKEALSLQLAKERDARASVVDVETDVLGLRSEIENFRAECKRLPDQDESRTLTLPALRA